MTESEAWHNGKISLGLLFINKCVNFNVNLCHQIGSWSDIKLVPRRTKLIGMYPSIPSWIFNWIPLSLSLSHTPFLFIDIKYGMFMEREIDTHKTRAVKISWGGLFWKLMAFNWRTNSMFQYMDDQYDLTCISGGQYRHLFQKRK